MFEQTFVDGEGTTHKGWTVALSFGGQIIAIGVLALIPLIYAVSRTKLKPNDKIFVPLDIVCSLVAAYGLIARMSRPWLTVILGLMFALVLFVINGLIALFIGCSEGLR